MKEIAYKVRNLQAKLRWILYNYVGKNLTIKTYEEPAFKEKSIATAKDSIKILLTSFTSYFPVFLMSLRCLRRHKVRTVLTVIGIIIGVTSIVSLNAVSEGMQKQMIDWIESSMGADLIVLGEGSSQFMPDNRFPENYAYEISSFIGVKSTVNLFFDRGFVNGYLCLIEGTSSDTVPSEITIVDGSYFTLNSRLETTSKLKSQKRLKDSK